jgi:hypothetical protein
VKAPPSPNTPLRSVFTHTPPPPATHTHTIACCTSHCMQELAQHKADCKAREAEDKEERAAARALEARVRRAAAAAAAAQKAAAFCEF